MPSTERLKTVFLHFVTQCVTADPKQTGRLRLIAFRTGERIDDEESLMIFEALDRRRNLRRRFLGGSAQVFR